jgi:hypothetical protein
VNWLDGNFDADPLFGGGFELLTGSPAIDAGRLLYANQYYLGSAPDMGALESDNTGGPPPAPNPEIHVQAQTVTQQKKMGFDTVLVTDQDNQPVAGVLVTATYYGPSQGQASGTTAEDGVVVLQTDRVNGKLRGEWCFEITALVKEGYDYAAPANAVTTQCESN